MKRPAEMWQRIVDELIKVLIAAEKLWLSNLKGCPSFAIHHEDKFYVFYQKNHCVLVFSNDGNIP